MSKPIRFERQYLPTYGCTVVALDCKLEDLQGHYMMQNGKAVVRLPERTMKDCRKLDGCVYMCVGRVSESRMNALIELYQKAKDNEKWNKLNEPMLPDDKLDLGV